MKVLVLGASGFLGGHVYNNLRNNEEIQVIGTSYKDGKNDKMVKLNINNNDEVEKLLKEFEPDIIIWCLMSKTSEKELIECGLKNLLNIISSNQKLVFISTNALFNEGRGNFSEDETPTYLNDNSMLAIYSNAKLYGEDLVKLHEKYIVIRPGIIYGQDVYGKWDNRILELIQKLNSNQKIERAKNMYNTFVKVEELANAIIELINIEYMGIIHLGPQNKQTYYDFYKNMAAKLNLDQKLIIGNYINEDTAKVLDKSLNTTKGKTILKSSFT